MVIRYAGNDEHRQIGSQNENARNRRAENADKSGRLQNGSISFANLGLKQDAVTMRRQQAMKRALKVVSDAWAGDKKIDEGIVLSKNRIQELRDDINENQEMVNQCNETKARLKEEYGIDDDSQEQKDLELLEKKNRAMQNPSGAAFTEKEQKRLKELEDIPLTEYQERVLEIDSAVNFYQEKINDAQNGIIGENAMIRGVRLERLKTHTMVDAQKEAEQIKESASKEIIGMLMDEAKDHIDETYEEEREKAKEEAEEKEEQEEKLEEKKEEQEIKEEELKLKQEENKEAKEVKEEQQKNAREQEELLEEAVSYSNNPAVATSQAQIEIKAMLQKMKLLEEDIKGTKVDGLV